MLHWSVTSARNLRSAVVEAQQPTHMKPFKNTSSAASSAAAETSGVTVGVATPGATSSGRLRAKAPKAPAALLANRHTVRVQERDDRPRQRVITGRASAESQSYTPSSRQEPSRRMCAVFWSLLSHRKSKETSVGARTSLANSTWLWTEARFEEEEEEEGRSRQSAAELPSRKRPTEGALWSCRGVVTVVIIRKYTGATADLKLSSLSAFRNLLKTLNSSEIAALGGCVWS